MKYLHAAVYIISGIIFQFLDSFRFHVGNSNIHIGDWLGIGCILFGFLIVFNVLKRNLWTSTSLALGYMAVLVLVAAMFFAGSEYQFWTLRLILSGVPSWLLLSSVLLFVVGVIVAVLKRNQQVSYSEVK